MEACLEEPGSLTGQHGQAYTSSQGPKNKQSKGSKQDTPSRGRRGGQPEMRSSSGECESGESQTLRRNGSKASASPPVVTFKAEEGQGSGSGDDEQTAGVSKAGRKADHGSSIPVLRSSKPDSKPKLPRPDGQAKCPRCDSEETKFCYYNNYNVKQPRYFCKGCQRSSATVLASDSGCNSGGMNTQSEDGSMGGRRQQAAQQAVAAQQQVYAAQHQLQQAAALQAQAQMQLGCGWGQSQNPYMGSMWPYNMNSFGPNWAAAAYASRLGAPAWNPLDGSSVGTGGSLAAPRGPTTGSNMLSGPNPTHSTMVPISAALVTSGYTWGNGSNAWGGNPGAVAGMNTWGANWNTNVTTGSQPSAQGGGDNGQQGQEDLPQSSQNGNHHATALGSHGGATSGSALNGSANGSSMLSGGSGNSTVTAGQLGTRGARSFDT
ncbi:hypothetical protein WJX72_010419 [[Myrmecia] bisecta]|uniref:Dof-type domain-containing protein n=1 Tax=[Myrmecia] bisecta TaxID=41462 RepID=A0AAW1PPM3_9CHLO